jgi:ParB family chromosome partitioning protein
MVHISEIEPNKSQPRKRFDEDALQELADSIKQYGVIQPLILQKRDKYYEIIAGERRWRAARMAGLKEVPAIIKDYSPREIVEIALIENIQREDLNPIEEAQTYHRLIEEFQLKQDEVAERVSKSRVAVTNSMRLLKLDERVQQMLIDDMLTSGHARALLTIENKDQQYNFACKIFDEKLSVRETEKLVKKIMNEKPEKEVATTQEDDFIYRDLENKIRTIIGTKVLIHKKNKNKGSIEIEYYSNEELERIMDLFETMSH